MKCNVCLLARPCSEHYERIFKRVGFTCSTYQYYNEDKGELNIQMLMMLMKVERRRRRRRRSDGDGDDDSETGNANWMDEEDPAGRADKTTLPQTRTSSRRRGLPRIPAQALETIARAAKMPLLLVFCCKYFFSACFYRKGTANEMGQVCLSPSSSLTLSPFFSRCVCEMNKFLSARNFTCCHLIM